MSLRSHIRSIVHTAILGTALVTTAGVTPGQAEEIDFSSDNALAQALLPYAPWAFDLVVQSARSFAEISYGRRAYDAVTGSFTANGLHVSRDGIDVTVRQLRAGANMLMLEGLDVDTRALDLPPPLRQALEKMGKERITGDLLVNVGFNAPRSAYDLTFRFDFPDFGSVALRATLDGFHVLVPLSDLENANLSNGPLVAGNLLHASIAYRDAGLVDAAMAVGAEQSGVSPEELRAGLKVMPSAIAGQLLAELPGGASEELRTMALGWARQAESFLDQRGDLRIAFDPPEPVPLARLQTGLIDEALIDTLNPTLSARFDAAVAVPTEPAGTLTAATALIAGTGVPQDRDAGALTLIGLAADGDLDAVRQIGTVFGTGPVPSLDARGMVSLYAFVLVAHAIDDQLSDQVLSRMAAAMTPDAVIEAERYATTYFYAHAQASLSDVALSPETIAGFDAGALRTRAFALYEGRGMPRNLTQAYAVALVAAAAGDPFAAKLRDDLATAHQDKRVVLSLSEARQVAALLWPAFKATHGFGETGEAAPQ